MKDTKRFPWMLGSIVLFLAIIGVIAYDVSRAGGVFPKSTTGRLLNDLGVLKPSHRAWNKTMAASARSYIWLEKNAPVYYRTAAEFSAPYAEVVRDVYKIAAKQACGAYENVRGYAADKAPGLRATLEQYAPGLLAGLQDSASRGWASFSNFTAQYYAITREYLYTKVFIGDWAPEVLQDKTLKAFNSTQVYMTEYYAWFQKQLDLYSKIQ